MNIQTITHARLNELIDTLELQEVCEVLKCTKDELIGLLKRMNEEVNE